MNHDLQEGLDHLEVAAGLLDALRDDVTGELASFENRRLTRDEQDRRDDLRVTLSQIESGVQSVWSRSEGTDPRLDNLLRRHEIASSWVETGEVS